MKIFELINAIEIRPQHFLREKNIWELEAFLRGFKCSEFSHNTNSVDEFIAFENWLNKYFYDDQSDWTQHFVFNRTDIEAFDYFFQIWDVYRITLNSSIS